MSELQLTGVTVSRGAGPVISDVTLTVRAGEILALVGPNGAGKTSLLESVSGVIQHSGGDIAVDGESIGKRTRVQRSRLGIAHIEQGRAIFPSLTVRENLMLTAGSEAAMHEVLASFPELEKRIDAQSVLLSGGEQQMVVLARAFASRPRFLLIDEMSLGLAPVVFMRLLPIIQDIAASGVGVLLVEQFTHLALGIADDAMVVASGRVSRAQGPARTLEDDPELLRRAYLGG
ncbi:ABC transporter ATP-binding protein [Leucobacter luti]|uniref:Amino acid/amide ABC transporter ATP-binding protein 2 (HAAT family) n=1 Tax=Leucobacter luti TaxID=340320 RepID=A0A4Q7U542_9MICO|nr:ATP-binding cassette domain-containing protein [Leucobacter luti]MBL3700988.1 ATP-binding cassette domain-containing protein [Leucobacter luti]RZT68791.1 amino acid/amide ABC transporter ATP-binding protein 2 (HAAT family) [Leucobacter luti]